MWRRPAKAGAICEHGQLLQQGQAGYLPLCRRERRLWQLEQADMQEGFLTVAMRDATRILIARHCPFALDRWHLPAAQLVSASLRFSQCSDRLDPSRVTCEPGSAH